MPPDSPSETPPRSIGEHLLRFGLQTSGAILVTLLTWGILGFIAPFIVRGWNRGVVFEDESWRDGAFVILLLSAPVAGSVLGAAADDRRMGREAAASVTLGRLSSWGCGLLGAILLFVSVDEIAAFLLGAPPDRSIADTTPGSGIALLVLGAGAVIGVRIRTFLGRRGASDPIPNVNRLGPRD